jgi:hypothetical protein
MLPWLGLGLWSYSQYGYPLCFELLFWMLTIPTQLLENVFQQDEDAANGMKNIVFLLVRYRELQDEVLVPEFKDTR